MIKKTKILLLLIVCSSHLLACSSAKVGSFAEHHRTLSALGAGEARVTFISPNGRDYGYRARIHIDSEQVVKLPRGRCFSTEVRTGRRKLMVDDFGLLQGSHELSVDVEEGEEYFYLVALRNASSATRILFGPFIASMQKVFEKKGENGNFEMTRLSNSKARELIDRCIEIQ